MKKTLDIKSVCECNRRLGCKTLHPQASIINLEHPDLEQEAVKFEFYAVLLIEEWLLRSQVLRLYQCHDGISQTRGNFPHERSGRVAGQRVAVGVSSRFTVPYLTEKSYQELYVLFL